MSKVWSSTLLGPGVAGKLSARGGSSSPRLRLPPSPLSLWDGSRDGEGAPQNLMFDRRVKRGNTYRPLFPPSAQQVVPLPPPGGGGPGRSVRSNASRAMSDAISGVMECSDMSEEDPANTALEFEVLPAPEDAGVASEAEVTQAAAGSNLVADVEELATELTAARQSAASQERELAAAKRQIIELQGKLDAANLAPRPVKPKKTAKAVRKKETAPVPPQEQPVEHETAQASSDGVASAEAAAGPELEPVVVSDTPEGHTACGYITELFAGAIAVTPLDGVVVEEEEGEAAAAAAEQAVSEAFSAAEVAASVASDYIAAVFDSAIEAVLATFELEETAAEMPPTEPNAAMPVSTARAASPVAAAAEDPATGEESETEWSDTDSEEEDEEGGDGFDMEMELKPTPRARASNTRRMSLADMKGTNQAAAMAKLRAQLTGQEVDEYRDFFDLVDADDSNSLDEEELTQVMRLMGMEAPEEQIKAMIGEVHDEDSGASMVTAAGSASDAAALEMNFEEFLTLMVPDCPQSPHG